MEYPPHRIDEDYPFEPTSLDERAHEAIRLENVERSIISDITTDGSIYLSGRDNIIRNPTLLGPAGITIRGQRNIVQNPRIIRRKR